MNATKRHIPPKNRAWAAPNHWHRRLIALDAFSLPELLVAIAAGSIIFLAANTLLIEHLQSSIRQESILRLQENWNRIRFIIDQDLNEGAGACFTSASTLTIYSIQGDTSKQITYQLNASNQLVRNGPPINADGALNLSGTDESNVVSDYVSSFSPVAATSSCSATTASRQPSYNLTLTETRNKIFVTYTNESTGATGSSKIDPIN